MRNSNIDLALDGNAEEHLNVFGRRKEATANRPIAQGSQTVVPVPSTTVVVGDNASVGTTKSMVADEAGSYAGGGGGGMSSAPSEEAAAEQSTDQAAADEAKKKKKVLMFLLIAGGAIALVMFSGKK